MDIFIVIGIFVLFLIIIELALHVLIGKLSQRFYAIITGKDKVPKLDKKKLKKFFKTGYDSELGWVRKPNTSKIENSFEGKKSYHINSFGSRRNPKHENLKTKIISFGDSFAFCREVNDNETWQYHLANLIKYNVANFGVGNYGLDQALLRFKREVKKQKDAKLVIVGVVPETIQRNLTVWKHYSEFKNTFGFKPRFILEKGKLKLIPNPTNTQEKFNNLKEIIPEINKHDFFYDYFKENLFEFPYTLSILKNPYKRITQIFFYSIIYFLELLKINWRKIEIVNSGKIKENFYGVIETRKEYYKMKSLTNLTLAILREFSRVAKENNLSIIFLMMPQIEDLCYAIEKKDNYYEKFINQAKKFIHCIDLVPKFIQLEDPLSIFPSIKYSESYIVQGGHYSNKGNEIVAEEINKFIEKNKVLRKSKIR